MQHSQQTRIFSIVNQKGGVGKTTTTINLATALAAIDYSVLIIDMDPQGNASTGVGIFESQRKYSSYDLFHHSDQWHRAVFSSHIPHLDIIPSSQLLSGIDIEFIEHPEKQYLLKNILNKYAQKYHYILIDCPPALNLLTINALVASSGVIVPLQCEFFALEGLKQLLETIQKIKKNCNNILEIQGILLTMYDKRNNLSQQVAQDVRVMFKNLVYKTIIPRNVRISEAPSHGLPALIYDHKSPGSKAYMDLAREILLSDKENYRQLV